MDDGYNIKLKNTYTLWSHDIYEKNWDIAGYKKICDIDNVAYFWQFINNLDKLKFRNHHFFLMKKKINPTWEDENNRNGGICSFKVQIFNCLKLYEDLCVYMVNNILCDKEDDINGISISPKNTFAIIKVWNKDSNNDISQLVNKKITEKYENLPLRYTKNAPEY